MNGEQHLRAEQILVAALEIASPTERRAYLDHECTGQSALRAEVESLLAAHAKAGTFLQNPAPGAPLGVPSACNPVAEPAEAGAQGALAEQEGDRIGRYKLLEKIGTGGISDVWMAEQEEPVRRRVALKIIKLGMDTREVIARFEAERQALALMDHPNIAKVHDGGATETGRPYFVMELVRGIRITDYCDQNSLPPVDRLKLFMLVCQAVQHAHQKGIIHRDLKPSNILVTVNDGVPVPKVIDFGIAKATEKRLTDKTVFTRFMQFLGTPAYMSPEQAELTSLDIDTRSDIYSLGVLLYELLTGRTPFDAKELLEAGLDEMRRIIREKEPARPSTRLSTLHDADLTAAAKRRQTDAPRLIKLLRADLDWIVMKALEKDRTRRYETANAFALDIRRHLNSEPVAACPPGNLYRFQKMVRRNKLAFGAAAAVTASLIIGFTFSTVLFLREKAARRSALQEKHRADEQTAIATTVNEFLQADLLAQAAPDGMKEEPPEPDLKVRTVLDRASQKIEGRFPKQPLVEAGLRITLARAYHGLGEYATQARHGRRALEIYRRELGETNAETLRAVNALGDAERHLGHAAEAVTLLKQSLETQQRVLGTQHTNTLRTMRLLAIAHLEGGQTNAARLLLEEALELATASVGKESELFADLLHNLAVVLAHEGKSFEAETIFRQVLALQRRLSTRDSAEVANILENLAAVLIVADRPAEAAPIAREAAALYRQHWGSEHLFVASAIDLVAASFSAQGKYAEELPLRKDALALRQKRLGEAHPEVAKAMNSLAVALNRQGRLAEAEEMCRKALAMRKQLHGDEHLDVADSLYSLAHVLHKRRKYSEAQTIHREALGIRKKLLGKEHRDVAQSLTGLAKTRIAQGAAAEGEAMCREAVAILEDLLGHANADVAELLSGLALALAAQGKFGEAQTKAREALAISTELHGHEHEDVATSLLLLGEVLQNEGRLADAETVLREALRMREKLHGNEHPAVAESRTLLGIVLQKERKLREAEAMMRAALAMTSPADRRGRCTPTTHPGRVPAAGRGATRNRVVRQPEKQEHPARLSQRRDHFHAIRWNQGAAGVPRRHARTCHRLAQGT